MCDRASFSDLFADISALAERFAKIEQPRTHTGCVCVSGERDRGVTFIVG